MFLLLLSLSFFKCGDGQTITFVINEIDDTGPALIDEFLSITVDAGLAKQSWSAFPWHSNLANTLSLLFRLIIDLIMSHMI